MDFDSSSSEEGNVYPVPRITARQRAIKKVLSGLMSFIANMCSASGDTPSKAINPEDRLRPLDALPRFPSLGVEGGGVIPRALRVTERDKLTSSCNPEEGEARPQLLSNVFLLLCPHSSFQRHRNYALRHMKIQDCAVFVTSKKSTEEGTAVLKKVPTISWTLVNRFSNTSKSHIISSIESIC